MIIYLSLKFWVACDQVVYMCVTLWLRNTGKSSSVLLFIKGLKNTHLFEEGK